MSGIVRAMGVRTHRWRSIGTWRPWARWASAITTILVLTAVISVATYAQRTANGPVLDNIAQTYHSAAQTWLARLLPMTQRTFTLLATLELVISSIVWTLGRHTFDDIAERFLLKFILMSFLLTLITSFTTWVTPIVSGFATAGQRATGLSGLSPSGVLSIGWSVSSNLLQTITLSNAVLNPLTSVFVALMAFGIWLAFAVIAAQLLRVLVESYIVLTGGVLFLGFAGFRATAGYAENYLNYAVYVGVKIFLLYLIVGVGSSITSTWAPLLSADNWNIGGGDSSLLSEVAGGSLLFVVLALGIPGTFASRLTGSSTLGVANALRSL